MCYNNSIHKQLITMLISIFLFLFVFALAILNLKLWGQRFKNKWTFYFNNLLNHLEFWISTLAVIGGIILFYSAAI